MPRGFGGARLLLLLPLGAVAAAPCAARPVAGGSDGDQERASWSTLQHLGLREEEVGAPTRWYLLLSFVSCVVLLPHLPESKTEPGCSQMPLDRRPVPLEGLEWCCYLMGIAGWTAGRGQGTIASDAFARKMLKSAEGRGSNTYAFSD